MTSEQPSKGRAVTQRISLSLVKSYRPQFDRTAQKAFLADILAAPSLADAVRRLRKHAKRFHYMWKPVGNRGHSWRYYLQRLARALSRGRDAVKIFGIGNGKLPFYHFSALPLFTCPGAGACASFCYSLKSWQYPTAIVRQLQNTLLLRFAPEVIESAFTKLPHGVVFRLYVDGDFDSLATVRFWFDLLKARPDVQAYGYSKSWDILAEYGQHADYPANYVLNLSTGGAPQQTSAEQMLALPITRNWFISVNVPRPLDKRGNWGHERYASADYHKSVRDVARSAGHGNVFSCPGDCGNCNVHGHVCGSHRFDKVTVAIGVH